MSEQNFNLSQIIEDAKKPTKSLEFKVISFSFSNNWELENLPVPKNAKTCYTATFFCRNKEDWFIVQTIFDVVSLNILTDPNLHKRLEAGARAIMDAHKQSRNPFKYLKDINIYPQEESDV